MNEKLVEDIVIQITRVVSPEIKHNDTINQLEMIFRKNGFYTTREYPIFKMKDKPERSGRIDLVARKGKFRVVIEYDHHRLIKWKSFQKMVQIKPDVAIGITGDGTIEENRKRAIKYKGDTPLYIVSLRDREYKMLG